MNGKIRVAIAVAGLAASLCGPVAGARAEVPFDRRAEAFCARAGRGLPVTEGDADGYLGRKVVRVHTMGCSQERYGRWYAPTYRKSGGSRRDRACARAAVAGALEGGYRAAVERAEAAGCRRLEDGSWYAPEYF